MHTVNENSVDIVPQPLLSLRMQSQDFTFAQKETNDAIYFQFSGNLDEMAKLPPVTKVWSKMTINLGAVSSLNSYGTRLWCAWIAKLGAAIDIRVEEAPVVFVKSFSAVKGCLPKNVDVMSFIIPFFL